MKLSYSKQRSLNSYKNYVGDFTAAKDSLLIETQWIIDNKVALSTNVDVPIVSSKIQWISVNIEEDVREFFDKALKLIVFG